jgi:sulfopyruvate decarboxylase TPP-binding subunit
MKTQPLKGLGGIIKAIVSLYLISGVPFVIYVCISGRLDARIALRSQRVRASHGRFRRPLAFTHSPMT